MLHDNIQTDLVLPDACLDSKPRADPTSLNCMDEYDVLGGYVPSFVQHLKDTGARFGLGIGSRTSKDLMSVGGTAAEAEASSRWTPAEHDAFFRAVSVHSRWRPDLIAACIPTKTEWEVWTYLDALEEGAAALVVQQDGDDVDMVGDAEMQVDGSDVGVDEEEEEEEEEEGVCKPALEVSEAWIDAEERMAAWIVREEHLSCVGVEGNGATAAADTEYVPQKRKRGRPRGTRARRRARAEPRAQDCLPPSEALPTPVRKRSRELSVLPTQRCEALMGHLRLPHLLVLDGILRGKSEDSMTGATPTEHGDGGEYHVPSSDPHETSESQSNAGIDPTLLAMPGGADTAERRAQGTLVTSTPGPSRLASLEVPLQHGSTNDATHTNPYPTANAESDLTLLSPRSRRRIQKRLYMRRKRALLHEANTVMDTRIEKLRPGKRAKSEQSEMPAVSTPSVTCSEAPSDAEEEVAESVPRKNKPGLTLPYRLKAKFSDLGVDAAYLVREGMDLLNLGVLGKLMGLWSSLELGEEEEVASAIVQSIDAELIRHLQAAMVSFVTDIVHRAIVWREREIRLKQRCQAWRQSDRITIAAIRHAVDAVGGRYHSHKEYFKSLAVSPPVSADQGAELSPHRDVYTPLVRHPSDGLACLTRTYEREATRTRRGSSADPEDGVMSDTTDEEALEMDMEEEEEMEEMDKRLGREEEERLWVGVTIKD